jgi:hypothetical protein
MDDDTKEPPCRARHLMDEIERFTTSLRAKGATVSVLPEPATAVLQTAAAGKAVDAAQLTRALAAAERLKTHLVWEILKRPPSLS